MTTNTRCYRCVVPLLTMFLLLLQGSFTEAHSWSVKTMSPSLYLLSNVQQSDTAKPTKAKRKLTRKEILRLKTETVLNMSFEEVEELLQTMGVSSIEELLNLIVSVASKKPQVLREAPGIVTIITEEEIVRSGARDMIDILRLIPGFDNASEVFGTVTMSIRGVYNQGKIAFLIDGNDCMERLYNNLFLGNHYPINQIQRIEIIRGPGSTLYGGGAEMAVVNIITKKASDIDGLTASVQGGLMTRALGRSNVNVSVGKEFSESFSMYGSMFFGNANRSDQTYTDVYGTSYDMKDFSSLRTLFINTGLSYQGFTLQFILDDYKIQQRDHYNVVLPEPINTSFKQYIVDAKYTFKVNDKLRVMPQVNFSRQMPWEVDNRELNAQYFTYFKATCDRYTAKLTSTYDITDSISLFGGGEYYIDMAEYDKDSYNLAPNSPLKYTYNAFALFAEGTAKLPFLNLTAGIRYEKQNQFGAALLPRFALTKVFDRFHAKLIYGNAFRAPGMEALRLNQSIRPELSRTLEMELGYQFNDEMLLSINVFDAFIKDPIVYVYENNKDNYFNFPSTGSRGLEAEYRIRSLWGYVTLNYSFYQANRDSIPQYQTIDYTNAGILAHGDVFLAFPQHKITLNGSFDLNDELSINPSFVWFSTRYGYTSVDAAQNLVLSTFPSALLFNISLHCSKLFIDGLSANLSAYDVLGTNFKFIAAYNSGHAPLPGPSREIVLRLQYTFH